MDRLNNLDQVRQLRCTRCYHIWKYRGKNNWIVMCPHCRRILNLRTITDISNLSAETK